MNEPEADLITTGVVAERLGVSQATAHHVIEEAGVGMRVRQRSHEGHWLVVRPGDMDKVRRTHRERRARNPIRRKPES